MVVSFLALSPSSPSFLISFSPSKTTAQSPDRSHAATPQIQKHIYFFYLLSLSFEKVFFLLLSRKKPKKQTKYGGEEKWANRLGPRLRVSATFPFIRSTTWFVRANHFYSTSTFFLNFIMLLFSLPIHLIFPTPNASIFFLKNMRNTIAHLFTKMTVQWQNERNKKQWGWRRKKIPFHSFIEETGKGIFRKITRMPFLFKKKMRTTCRMMNDREN